MLGLGLTPQHPETGKRPFKLSTAGNLAGEKILRDLERLPRVEQGRQRCQWLYEGTPIVVTPGKEVIKKALESYPVTVARLCARAKFYRFMGVAGAFYPGRNEIWMNAWVETLEGRNQIYASGRHELFHYVDWNHPFYRVDQELGRPCLLGAIEESRGELRAHPGYVAFLRRFLKQGDHANPTEFFSDVPTNIFNEIRSLPYPLVRYFGPLIWGGPVPAELLARHPRVPEISLEEFHRLLDPGQVGAKE